MFSLWATTHVSKRTPGLVMTGKSQRRIKGSIRHPFGLIGGPHWSRSGGGWGRRRKGERSKSVLAKVRMKQSLAGSDTVARRETQHSLKEEEKVILLLLQWYKKLQCYMITVAKSTPRFYFYKKSDIWAK